MDTLAFHKDECTYVFVIWRLGHVFMLARITLRDHVHWVWLAILSLKVPWKG